MWFNKHDHDGNGVLDHSEFRELLKSIGSDHDKLHPKYVDHFLKVTDSDGDGAVTLEDFTKVRACSLQRRCRLRRKRALLDCGRFMTS